MTDETLSSTETKRIIETHSQENLEALFPENRLHQLQEQLADPRYDAIFELMETTGAEIYIVGGGVRDTLTGKDVNDIDLVVRYPEGTDEPVETFEGFFGEPQENDVIAGDKGQIKLRGARYGSYKFYPAGSEHEQPIDIVFTRSEEAIAGSVGGRSDFLHQIEPTLPIEEDMMRRDFTINSLAMRIERTSSPVIASEVHVERDEARQSDDTEHPTVQLTLVDAVGGLTDLQEKRLRTVGDPHTHLRNDLTRILRAVRFDAQGYEMTPELKTAIVEIGEDHPLQALRPDGSPVIDRQSFSKEFFKAMGANPTSTLQRYHEAGILTDMLHTSDETSENNAHIEGAIAAVESYTDEQESTHNNEITLLMLHHLRHPETSLTYVEQMETIIEEMNEELELDTVEAGPNKMYPKQVIRYVKRIDALHQNIGILEQDATDAEIMAVIDSHLPDYSEDTLLRILPHLGIFNSQQIDAIHRHTAEAQETSEHATIEFTEIGNGNVLQEHFRVPEGKQFGTMMGNAENAFRETSLRGSKEGKYITESDYRREIALAIVPNLLNEETWERIPTIETNALNQLSELANIEVEDVRKIIAPSMVRTGIESYTHTPLSEFGLSAEAMQQLENAEAISFGDLLTTALAKHPQDTIQWLDTEIKREESYTRHMLTEIVAMNGCEQDDTYHLEGDVWEHVQLMFQQAEPPISKELALAILTHDAGKPVTREVDGDRIRFIGHERVSGQMVDALGQRLGIGNDESYDVTRVKEMVEQHGMLFDKWQDGQVPYLTLRREFPNGSEDDFLKLIKADTRASVMASGERPTEPLAELERRLLRIDLERNNFGVYEELMGSDEIERFMGGQAEGVKAEYVYEQMIKIIEHEEEINANTLVLRALQQEHAWASWYVGSVIAPSDTIQPIANRTLGRELEGVELGEIQNGLIAIIDDGKLPTEADIDEVLRTQSLAQIEM